MATDPTRQFQRREYDRARSTAEYRRWYKLARWKRRAKAQLEAEPFCEMCEALSPPKVTAADIADHVVPHRGDYQLFWFGKLQSLCSTCHDGPKQAEERRGFVQALGDDGWPADPRHPFNSGGVIRR